MTEPFFDHLETRDASQRERALFSMLPELLKRAIAEAPGWADHLTGIDAEAVCSRASLAALPILRKSALHDLQAKRPPFGGFAIREAASIERVFMSPGVVSRGPIFDPEGRGDDWWRSARALHAARVGRGDIVLNTFSYHLTPGGWIIDAGLKALGCSIIPAGPGNVEQQLEAIAHLKPSVYVGVPDFLKVLLDRARETGRPAGSLRKALVLGGALSATMRAEFRQRGVSALQAYAIADAGVIAYEAYDSQGDVCDGMIVDEGVIVEIVRPGTSDPVVDGEVGEVVVTTFNRDYPMFRLATGDLSAIVPGQSACGRTNARIRGWMGRAEQAARVQGVTVNPEQVAEIGKRHGELARLRLVVNRSGECDALLLRAEAVQQDPALADRIAQTLADVTKMKGEVELVSPGSLPNDGRVVADERHHA